MAISISVGQKVLCTSNYGNSWAKGMKVKTGTVGIVLSVSPDGSKCEIAFELNRNNFSNRWTFNEKDFSRHVIPISN